MANTPRNSGVFNLGALGGDGAATTRPARRWGGMTGRSLTNDVTLPAVIDHSLRFDGSSDHMTRTFGTPTSNTTWTLSFWFKRSRSGTREMLFSTPGATNQLYFEFKTDDKLYARDYLSGGNTNWELTTAQTFTDNDWHHAVLMLDGNGTTTATKSKLYIDGVDLSTTIPSGLSTHNHTNISSFWNSNNVVHYIGQYYTGANWFDGQLAEVHFIDGQALDASYFGEYNASGQWAPKEVTGLTYGNNGFYLPLSTPSSETNAFNAVTYSGTRGTQAVTGVAFQPDFVWLKSRTNQYVSGLFDTVRGGGNHLCSSLANGNIVQDANGYLDSFDADGFTLIEKPSNTGVAQTWNETGQNYIAWAWKAGGAPTSNGSAMVDGVATTTSSIATAASASITPTRMSVNTEAGFSIVEWSGTENDNGGNEAIPHGLNSAPELIIFKSTITGNWIVGSDYLGNTAGWNKQLYLNLTNSVATSSASFNDTAPTSSTFTVGASDATNDKPSSAGAASMIAYCFHSVSGYSKIGSYTGNGSADGPKVNCGFKPAFLMIKNVSSGSSHWIIYDNARNPQTDATKKLGANAAYEENNTTYYGNDSVSIDLLADGFHITATGLNHNNSGNTYLFMAFADTSPNLGLDATTNSNNFAVNGAITPDDQLIDTPNLRFATLNPNDAASGAALSNANLTAGELGANTPVRATQGKASGKWYFEFRATSGAMNDHVGVWDVSETLGTNYVGATAGSWGMFLDDSRVRNTGGSDYSYASGAWTSGQVGMIAMDLDNGKLYFGRDGTWFSSGDPVQGTNPAFSGLTGTLAAATTSRDTTTFNFGQDHTFAGTLAPLTTPYTDADGNGEFYYQPPAGYKALATKIVGSDAVLQSTGVLTLAEHYQTKL